MSASRTARVTFTRPPAGLVVKFTSDPRSFPDFLQALDEDRWDGQLIVNFRRGHPTSADFPVLERIPLAPRS